MSNYSEKRRAERRLWDFVILGLGAFGLLGLLVISGALGGLEFLTGSFVLLTGFMAYYIGSTPTAAQIDTDATSQAGMSEPAPPGEIENLLMTLPFAALMISADQRIAAINPKAAKILGRHETRGALANTVLRQPELLDATKRVAQSAASEMLEFTLHGDTETWMAYVQSGAAIGSVIVIFEDRTEVRRAERARADFLANASHELRTPLTALAGFIETMRGPAKDDKDAWENFLEIMQQQTERMKRLVTDLLSLSRIEFSEHRAPDTLIELNTLVRRTQQGLEPIAAERKVDLKLSLPEETMWAIADADEIVQIIQNLASNAIKYTPHGGEVEIRLGHSQTMASAARESRLPLPEARRVQLLNARASREVPAAWIRISDNGSGIPAQHLPRLGERFYRVDESRGGKIEGTGLGLAIVKHIIARHRGGFAVESVEEHGSIFSVWMPRVIDVD